VNFKKASSNYKYKSFSNQTSINTHMKKITQSLQKKQTLTFFASYQRLLIRASILSLFAILVYGCATPITDKYNLVPPRSTYPAYTLKANDQVRISVYENAEISQEYTVAQEGTISLPLIGRIPVADLSLSLLEESITQKLRDNLIADPKVSIELVTLRHLCVLGEVRSPGCFPYQHGMTISEAIALASGFTYRAEKNEIIITWDNENKSLASSNTPVFSGDIIEVMERHF